MNPHLIEKVIKTYNDSCPELLYSNPLLDAAVTKALSKSFVRVLTSKQNTNVHKNLRLSVLKNICKICKIQPEGHLKVHQNHIEVLLDVYKDVVFSNSSVSETDQLLSAFLLKTLIGVNVKSCDSFKVNPEVIQAILNLDSSNHTILSEYIIHLNTSDIRCFNLLNNLWKQNIQSANVVIKIKPQIETILLSLCVKILTNRTIDVSEELKEDCYQNLLCTSAKVANCFQICCSILNSVLTCTNFDSRILEFVYYYIKNVKIHCEDYSFPSLYSANLSHIVVLMDIELNNVPGCFKEEYIKETVGFLKEIEGSSNFTMLISHFPQWFAEC